MKTFLVAASALLYCSFASAQYTLQASENDDYRDWTLEEMTSRIGENSVLLPYYKCNGKDELDPFFAPPRSNPRKDSLKVKSRTDGVLFVYREGTLYDLQGNEATEVEDKFVNQVAEALSKLENLSSASKLLRFLEASNFPLEIRYGNNSFAPKKPEQTGYWPGLYMAQAISYFKLLRMTDYHDTEFDNIGSGGIISWQPLSLVINETTQKPERATTIDDDGVRRIFPHETALAHEMYHAFDSIRGLLDMRSVVGKGYEYMGTEEYRAVHFENLVRGEQGLHYRKFYADPYKVPEGGLGDPNADDMLVDGKPVFIPNVCL